MVSEGGRRVPNRSDRHRRNARLQHALLAAVAGALLVGVVIAVALMFAGPPIGSWPAAHALRTAELQVAAMWEQSAADAIAMGQDVLELTDDHVAAWLNHLFEADVADPLFAVANGAGAVTLRYRLRLPFDLSPVVTLELRPALVDGLLFCAIDSITVGRCPIPAVAWRLALRPASEDQQLKLGWAQVGGAVGYAWPAATSSPAGPVEIRGIACTPGLMSVTLAGVK